MNLDRPGTIFCFGEVLLRLSAPRGTRIQRTSAFDAHVGGAEANVAAILAQLGNTAEILTVLPRSSLGGLCEGELRRSQVGTQHVVWQDGRLGLYFVGPALGSGTQVTYDRKDSVFCSHADEFEWQSLAARARWFHLSGINLAIGDKPAKAALAAVEAMKADGAPISFDVNHRASLWKDRPAHEFARVRQIVEQVDVLFASPRDIEFMLKVEGGSEPRTAAEKAFGAFPSLQLIASTRRKFDEDRQLLSARIDDRNVGHETADAPLRSMIDRIGSGDAFAGAVIDCLLGKGSLEECAKRGLAAAVSKHTIAGDRWVGTREELYAYDPLVREDIQR